MAVPDLPSPWWSGAAVEYGEALAAWVAEGIPSAAASMPEPPSPHWSGDALEFMEAVAAWVAANAPAAAATMPVPASPSWIGSTGEFATRLRSWAAFAVESATPEGFFEWGIPLPDGATYLGDWHDLGEDGGTVTVEIVASHEGTLSIELGDDAETVEDTDAGPSVTTAYRYVRVRYENDSGSDQTSLLITREVS